MNKKKSIDTARRTRLSLLCILILTLGTFTGEAYGQIHTKKELVSKLIQLNDEAIPAALNSQLLEKEAASYGAVFDGDSVLSPIRTAQLIETLMCAYVSSNSKYYKAEAVLQRMTLAAAALVHLQHEDGTIDLISTNFHSTPDLGFTIYPLALAYSIMQKNSSLDYGELSGFMKRYLLKAGEALAVGGIHTPNHRWVVSGALAWINAFFPNPKYKSRIEQWLAEKIDIDPDGQYHERSTAVYTPVTNRSLIYLAEKMQYDYLYDVIGKNLDMTFYFVHTNGEIATESSKRQDKYLQHDMAGYYFAYNYMALHNKDQRYAGMVHYIERTVPVNHLLYMLPVLIEDPTLMRDVPEGEPLPKSYHKHFSYSDMVRIRDGRADMSIITNNATFFTFFKGEAALEAVRLSSAFFGKGQFVSQQLKREGNTYILSSVMEGPYYQPLPKEKIPHDTDAWSKVPRSEREKSEVQVLRATVYITPDKAKARIRVSVDGPQHLPVTLELGFRSGGSLHNVSAKQGIANAFLIREGSYATYRKGADTISVGPGVRAHKWTQLRGALPKLDAECVYFTDYAPCEFEFIVE